MSLIVRAIRNAPPEYPWENSARQALRNMVDVRWRSYCIAQSVAAVIDALAGALTPFTSRKDRRESVVTNLNRGRDYLGMAAKKWR